MIAGDDPHKAFNKVPDTQYIWVAIIIIIVIGIITTSTFIIIINR